MKIVRTGSAAWSGGIKDGKGVLISVSAGQLWGMDLGDDEISDHVVTVTGVACAADSDKIVLVQNSELGPGSLCPEDHHFQHPFAGFKIHHPVINRRRGGKRNGRFSSCHDPSLILPVMHQFQAIRCQMHLWVNCVHMFILIVCRQHDQMRQTVWFRMVV